MFKCGRSRPCCTSPEFARPPAFTPQSFISILAHTTRCGYDPPNENNFIRIHEKLPAGAISAIDQSS